MEVHRSSPTLVCLLTLNGLQSGTFHPSVSGWSRPSHWARVPDPNEPFIRDRWTGQHTCTRTDFIDTEVFLPLSCERLTGECHHSSGAMWVLNLVNAITRMSWCKIFKAAPTKNFGWIWKLVTLMSMSKTKFCETAVNATGHEGSHPGVSHLNHRRIYQEAEGEHMSLRHCLTSV